MNDYLCMTDTIHSGKVKIMDKKLLKEILQEEKSIYIWEKSTFYKRFIERNSRRAAIWRFIAAFRKMQYWREIKQTENLSKFKLVIAKILSNYYATKADAYGLQANVEIRDDIKLGRGCNIWHGGVVINGNVGDYCIFHGNNILGNKGATRLREIPTLGNNVDVGAGAVIIGKVTIADGCVIGANSVVVSSFTEPNTTIVGVPGRPMKTKQ